MATFLISADGNRAFEKYIDTKENIICDEPTMVEFVTTDAAKAGKVKYNGKYLTNQSGVTLAISDIDDEHEKDSFAFRLSQSLGYDSQKITYEKVKPGDRVWLNDGNWRVVFTDKRNKFVTYNSLVISLDHFNEAGIRHHINEGYLPVLHTRSVSHIIAAVVVLV